MGEFSARERGVVVVAVEEADLKVLIVVLDEAGAGKHVVHRSAGVLALYGLLTAADTRCDGWVGPILRARICGPPLTASLGWPHPAHGLAGSFP